MTTEPSREEMAQLRRALRSGAYGRPTRDRYQQSRATGVVVAAMVGGFLGLITGIMAIASLISGDTEDALIATWFTVGIVAIGAILGWLTHRSENRHWTDIWRLVTFAKANGLEVQPAAKVKLLPGSIFTTKAHASTTERVTWTVDGCPVEVARHHRASGGRTPNSFEARYLAVQLGDVPRLSFTGARGPARPGMIAGPELVLTGSGDGRREGTLTSLPGTGDATRAFMTDELVDLLTDPDHACNAEAVGGWFFAYYPVRGGFEADRWRHVVSLAEAVVRARTRAST